VVELGPGDSIGAGIASLLTGAEMYAALDLVHYARTEKNVEMVEALGRLLTQRAPLSPLPLRPTEQEIPFPHHVLGEKRLTNALSPARIDAIRAAVADPGSVHKGVRVTYAAGQQAKLELQGAADVVFSQAVLEHVDDLQQVYAAVSESLRPGGFAAHTIDFRSHSFARDWNGHWTYSDRAWAVVRGRRRFAINREPLSTHLQLIEASGLEVVAVRRTIVPSPLRRVNLAPRFRGMSSDDLETASAVVHAVKP
jgi:SAM-dependent methyltransferase